MAEVLEQEKRRAEAHAAQLTEQANARVAAAEMRAHAELQVLVLVSKVVAVLVHLLSCRCDIAILANMLLNGLVCDRGYVLQYMTVCLLGVCVGVEVIWKWGVGVSLLFRSSDRVLFPQW